MPIFLALFRLIDQAAKNGTGHGLLTDDPGRSSSRDAELFGAKISDIVHQRRRHRRRAGPRRRSWCVAMTATTFLTQRQLMSKNMPADALTGPYAQQQKMLLYVLPVVFAVGGIAFPIGVLLYWTTSNLWTMGQQFYVIRNNPAPGHRGRQGQAGARRGEARAQGPARGPGHGDSRPVEPEPEAPAPPSASSPRSRPAASARSSRRPPGRQPAAGAARQPRGPSEHPASTSGRRPHE